MKPDETNTIDYWKQVAKDAIDARDRMEERQRAIVSECERLRIERDTAVRNAGSYQQQIRGNLPDVAELLQMVKSGEISLYLSMSLTKGEGS